MSDKTISHSLLHYHPPTDRLKIIHEDDDLLVVDKPAGLLTVPGKDLDHWDCLEHRAKSYCSDARIVHRLDMATSGLVVMAKNHSAHRHLGLQFERRHIKKRYDALVAGGPPAQSGQTDLPLICDWPNRPRQKIDHEQGKRAVTDWTREAQLLTGVWHMALFPITGRSHQLRVHMAALGCPIVGDVFYAPITQEPHVSAARMMLHASQLTLRHPVGGEENNFVSPAPFISQTYGI